MRIGYLTEYNHFAMEYMQSAGIHEAEFMCDRGMSFDLDVMDIDDIKRMKDTLDKNNIHLGAFAWYITNHLEPDAEKRKENYRYFRKIIDAAHIFGTDIVSFGTQHHPSQTMEGKGHMEEALVLYRDNFTEYAHMAEGEGIRITTENCPEFGNLAYSPEATDAMFEMVPSKSIYLEFDPSHLLFEGIDAVRYIKYYKDRIISVHAKDAELNQDNLFRYGFLGKRIGKVEEKDLIFRYRLPGLGQVDWKSVFNALYEIQYNGPVFIEMEDPFFFGGPVFTDDPVINKKRQEGVTLTKRFLERFIP